MKCNFYPTALKGCRGIVFTHGIQMGGRPGGRVGGRWEIVCLGCISETVRCRKLILGRDIGCISETVRCRKLILGRDIG